ncbi:tripartite tricarboxylate transporter substrate binding protein [Ottowia sp.]|uniref:tripartite tricarboxylate transporter substrate binding protein n=1 Tax=Ottowia sp. TaxID=1898956 RepID=UPI002CE4CA9A|nr:tripartite tricarboxylate transporter substrate binding protein [Ottowia sp.]HPK31480.1 tripartite tricarboxylate transporter substrate binding protein [Ottowia sp.]HPR43952.1 tripartite tricarboxylate transporter substrate binding protein [Ottowia sp.]HRW73835.1 tripartite tricarboxylate transporter substrate binding protein [Ottowia sp.]
MTLTRRQFTLAGLGAAGIAAAPALRAAGYPDRPIVFICPWSPGGTADTTMRALCQAASKDIGQSIVVENKAGASGMIGLRAMANAKPDGYTIGQIPISVTRFSQLGTVKLDPMTELTYIARVSGQTFGTAVLPTAPWKTLQELVADAKARPGKITFASAGVGGATHVGWEEFLMAAGIRMNHIPFKGGAEALQAVLGGHVDLLVDSSSWAPMVRDGKLRLLATWGEQRTQAFKDVPTLKDLGYNVVVDAPNGIGAPKGLDPAVAARLRAAFKVAAASPEFSNACAQIEAPLMYLDGPDYAKYVEATYRKETQLIDRLKLKELMAKG